MSRRWTMLIAKVVTYSGLLSIVLAVTAIIIGYAEGNRLLSVQTGSMTPTFRPGDAIVTRRVPFSTLQTGQIVSYRNASNRHIVISHRIIAMELGQGAVITKGDNVSQADLAVHQVQIIGQAVAVAPRLGSLMNWLHRPLGLICAIYGPATFVIGAETYHYLRQPVRTRYRQ